MMNGAGHSRIPKLVERRNHEDPHGSLQMKIDGLEQVVREQMAELEMLRNGHGKKLESLQRVNQGQTEIIQRQATDNAKLEFLLRQERRMNKELAKKLESFELSSTGVEFELQLNSKQQKINQLEEEKEALANKLKHGLQVQESLRHERHQLQKQLEKSRENRNVAEGKIINLQNIIDLLTAENESLKRDFGWDKRSGSVHVISPKQRDKILSASSSPKTPKNPNNLCDDTASVHSKQSKSSSSPHADDDFEDELVFENKSEDGERNEQGGGVDLYTRRLLKSPPVPALKHLDPLTSCPTKLFLPIQHTAAVAVNSMNSPKSSSPPLLKTKSGKTPTTPIAWG